MKGIVITIMSVVILAFIIAIIKFAITKPSDGNNNPPKYL